MVQAMIENKSVTVTDQERQKCEIWTRVMGYYRPVSEFNIGKKGEHIERAYYAESKVISG
jgi:anaerobic ribonucleoside-triphosphate reductase